MSSPSANNTTNGSSGVARGGQQQNEQIDTSTSTVIVDDWRGTVQQSFRNAEVREIATVLASLEPGAKTSSKLRLAMQFEDSVFKSASSLDDYRKRLTKRLKKVQKSYKPPIQDDTSKETIQKEREIQLLRLQYSDPIRYILKHTPTALREMEEKHGKDKANQLKQHTDGVQIWASELGLLLSESNNNNSNNSNNNKPNTSISNDQLKKLRDLLERKLSNIRIHVVKLAEPDRFLAENLDKVENDLKDNPITSGSNVLAELSRKRLEQWYKKSIDVDSLLIQSIELANKAVPLPTVRYNTKQNDDQAALVHLDKLRAAGTAINAFIACKNKNTILANKNCLSRMYTIGTDGCTFVQRIVSENRKQQKPEQVTLQDAWMKQLIVPPSPPQQQQQQPEDLLVNATTDYDDTNNRNVKRLKVSNSNSTINSSRPIIRSRVLLTPNRNVPSSVVRALKCKRAKLVRPEPIGQGTYIILEFGTAFVMYIYLVPLLVSIRAISSTNDDTTTTTVPPSNTVTNNEWSCTRWLPLHHGLNDSVTTTTTTTTTTNSTTPGGTTMASKSSADATSTTSLLTVYGVKGSYETIGSIVEERLRDCSAHATNVLRKCFTKHVLSSSSNDHNTIPEYEIEIYEASALLEFLHIARTTYIPNWEDDE